MDALGRIQSVVGRSRTDIERFWIGVGRISLAVGRIRPAATCRTLAVACSCLPFVVAGWRSVAANRHLPVAGIWSPGPSRRLGADKVPEPESSGRLRAAGSTLPADTRTLDVGNPRPLVDDVTLAVTCCRHEAANDSKPDDFATSTSIM